MLIQTHPWTSNQWLIFVFTKKLNKVDKMINRRKVYRRIWLWCFCGGSRRHVCPLVVNGCFIQNLIGHVVDGKRKTLTCWGRSVSLWTGLIRARGPRTARSGPPPPPLHARSAHDCVCWSCTAGRSGTERQTGNNTKGENREAWDQIYFFLLSLVGWSRQMKEDILTSLWQHTVLKGAGVWCSSDETAPNGKNTFLR